MLILCTKYFIDSLGFYLLFPADAAMELEAMNAEVTEDQPEPPPYNEAMSRLDAGISRQVETTFGPEVITGPVRDEPPHNYTDIGELLNYIMSCLVLYVT